MGDRGKARKDADSLRGVNDDPHPSLLGLAGLVFDDDLDRLDAPRAQFSFSLHLNALE